MAVVMKIAKPIYAFQMPQLRCSRSNGWTLSAQNKFNSTGKCLIGRNRQWLNSHLWAIHSIALKNINKTLTLASQPTAYTISSTLADCITTQHGKPG
jgi:hypothetical protein